MSDSTVAGYLADRQIGDYSQGVVLLDTYSTWVRGSLKISSMSAECEGRLLILTSTFDIPGAVLANNAQCRGSTHCQCVWLFRVISSPSACDRNMTNQVNRMRLYSKPSSFKVNLLDKYVKVPLDSYHDGKSRLEAQIPGSVSTLRGRHWQSCR